MAGDPVTSLSGCRVTSIDDWNACIASSIKEESLGNCMSVDLIKEMDASPKSKNKILSLITYMYMKNALRFYLKANFQDFFFMVVYFLQFIYCVIITNI